MSSPILPFFCSKKSWIYILDKITLQNCIKKIIIDKRVFQGLNGGANTDTPIDPNKFVVVANDAAVAASNELIIYSSSTGKLFYNENSNSSGFGEGGQFAILQGKPDLVAQDFVVA